MDYRIEHDTMGEVRVPANHYWGAQTQRSHENFPIGTERIPEEVIFAFAVLKKAAALANCKLGNLDERRANAIAAACDEILAGRLADEFPLVVWQTGSGTQSNMNVNEVVAARANALLGEKLVHPNDHVNKSQSSNDTFPTAMHIAALIAAEDHVLPAAAQLRGTLERLSAEYADVIKVGRTHLQDATPLTLGQEISGWAASLEKDERMIRQALDGVRELALGGTVGAIALYQMKRGPRKALLSIVNLPMLNSEVVTGVSLMLLYAMVNIQLGYLTLLLSHIAFCVPYVVLSVMPKLRQLDPNLAEAAQDLGATPMQGFFKVILPDIMPGVFSGFIMALTMSIDDFVVSFFTTGSGVSNLSITIYTMAKRGISPKINALSTIIFACVFVLLIGLNLRDFRKDGRSQRKLDEVKIPY